MSAGASSPAGPSQRRPFADSSPSDNFIPPHRLSAASAFDNSLLMKPFSSGQPKSLSGIALRGFCLGMALATGIIGTFYILVFTSSPIWRVPFFLSSLSLFHFLEFWVTAERNTLVADTSSFLLTSNWPAYAIAHSSAFAECLIVSLFFPARAWAPTPLLNLVILALGLVITAGGQIVRTTAMYQAGGSFNHQVQMKKADSHVLVTTGIYSVFRHPSYFGFFYWGLGTQLVLGNVVCFFAYAAALWIFFNARIRVEERKLVEFFQDDYVNYRKRVGTKMPFIP